MATYLGTSLSRTVRGKLGEQVFYYSHGANIVRQAPAAVTRPPGKEPPRRGGIPPEIPEAWDGIGPEGRKKWNNRLTVETNLDCGLFGIWQIIPRGYEDVRGYPLFVKINSVLISAGLALVNDPPWQVGPILTCPIMSIAWVALTAEVQFSWPIVNVLPAGSRVRCWIYSPEGIFHRQILGTGLYEDGVFQSPVFRAAKGADLQFTNFPGLKIMGQMDVISPTGKRSAGSNTEIISLP